MISPNTSSIWREASISLYALINRAKRDGIDAAIMIDGTLDYAKPASAFLTAIGISCSVPMMAIPGQRDFAVSCRPRAAPLVRHCQHTVFPPFREMITADDGIAYQQIFIAFICRGSQPRQYRHLRKYEEMTYRGFSLWYYNESSMIRLLSVTFDMLIGSCRRYFVNAVASGKRLALTLTPRHTPGYYDYKRLLHLSKLIYSRIISSIASPSISMSTLYISSMNSICGHRLVLILMIEDSQRRCIIFRRT